jgi:hypothetical protein
MIGGEKGALTHGAHPAWLCCGRVQGVFTDRADVYSFGVVRTQLWLSLALASRDPGPGGLLFRPLPLDIGHNIDSTTICMLARDAVSCQVMFEFLSRRLPYKGKKPGAVIHFVLQGKRLAIGYVDWTEGAGLGTGADASHHWCSLPTKIVGRQERRKHRRSYIGSQCAPSPSHPRVPQFPHLLPLYGSEAPDAPPVGDLMSACWAHDPSQRPAFSEVAARLRACVAEMGGDPRDGERTGTVDGGLTSIA